MNTYTARCVRAGDWWAIHVPEADGVWTQTRGLDQADKMAREAIAAVLDVDEASFDVVIEVELDDPALDELVDSVRQLRQQAERAQREASTEMEHAVQVLRGRAGLSMRDVAKLLGVSHQRVGQLSRR